MTNPFSSPLALVILFLLGAAVPAAQADKLIESCNACHDGQNKDVPVISGISSFAFETAMLAYVDGSREARPFEGKDMKTVVENLTEAEFKKTIEHYSSQEFTPVKQDFDKALAEKGKKIHDAYCARCHTEGGSLADDDSSILAGQWKGYLIEEMQNYKDGTRTGDRKMSEAMQDLSDEHIQALAEYYASQQ